MTGFAEAPASTRARVAPSRTRSVPCGLRRSAALALDDFGAGFASFYYLKHLDCDYIKIDGEFIHRLAHNRTNRLIVQSIAGIARGLGRATIAEFVDDPETIELLRRDGIDYAQGFHLGKPKPLGECNLSRAPAIQA